MAEGIGAGEGLRAGPGKGARARLWPIYVTIFMTGVYFAIFNITLPLYLRSLGVTEFQWGQLAAIFAVGLLPFEIFWGVLSDRMDRRLIVFSTIGSVSVVAILYLYTTDLLSIAILQVFRGALGVAFAPVARAMITDFSSPSQRGRGMASFMAGMQGGQISGAVMAGYVAQAWGYRSVLQIVPIFTIAACLPMLCLPKLKHERVLTEDPPISIRGMLFRRSYLLINCLGIIIFIVQSLVGSFLPIFAVGLFNATSVQVGWAMAAYGGAVVSTGMGLGRIVDRLGRRRAIVIGYSLTSGAAILYAFSQSIYEMILSTALVGAGFVITNSSQLALLADYVPPQARGSAMGIFGAFEDVGIIIGPLAYGSIWAFYNPRGIFYFAALSQIVGVIVGTVLIRSKRQG